LQDALLEIRRPSRRRRELLVAALQSPRGFKQCHSHENSHGGTLDIVVPTGLRYTAKVSGTTVKLVRCGGCQCEFVYLMKRTGVGHGRSPFFLNNAGAQSRAHAAATKQLERRLANEIDAVPCIGCGALQSDMVRKLRAYYLCWLWIVGALIVVISLVAIAIVLSPDPRPLAAPKPSLASLLIYPAIGVAMIIAWFIFWIRYNPNALSAEEKAKRFTSPTMDRATFDKKAADNQRPGYVAMNPATFFDRGTGVTPAPLIAVAPPPAFRPARRSPRAHPDESSRT
jgi:hypothetical protein